MRISTYRRKRGQALIEFACVLPFLLILLMLIIQYGILLNARLSLYHVSRNAGRFAAVRALNPNSNKDVQDYAKNMARTFRITLADSDITFHRYDANYDPDPKKTPPISPENTQLVNTNRTAQNPLIVRIKYNTSQKLFLPSKFFGVTVFSESMVVDNIVMME